MKMKNWKCKIKFGKFALVFKKRFEDLLKLIFLKNLQYKRILYDQQKNKIKENKEAL